MSTCESLQRTRREMPVPESSWLTDAGRAGERGKGFSAEGLLPWKTLGERKYALDSQIGALTRLLPDGPAVVRGFRSRRRFLARS
jgi:hypothetical protein